MNNLPFSPAAERNKHPILDILRRVLPAQGRLLEIASGTGQHAAWFATALPGWQWQPSEAQAHSAPVIAAWAAEAGAHNVLPALTLDVLATPWPLPDTRYDAIYCANLLHIAPWPVCAALMEGAARHLTPDGLLITYGPYLEDGVPTSPGNQSFDASLRAQDPGWGLRRREDVAQVAQSAGLVQRERHAMPANNLLLVWGREP
ncbi:DUF938 domain-containing protein [Hydrogenophaga palleronii]|uniref:DUF938 domain-containing protein n=1 Tax=Hydrogenophaga palleronii TaxID=65655 RepID=UPI0008268C05|nr:DUF938 domain-containing protein [Hydrogenophaga palleronii]